MSKDINEEQEKILIKLWASWEAEAEEEMVKAQNGDPEAQYLIALRYSQGWGIEVDMQKSIYWLHKAASQNYQKARVNLAHSYFYGEKGVAVDKGKALILKLENARDGCKFSQFEVGFSYYHGIGCEKNIEKAKYWLKQAGMQGHDEAIALLHLIKGHPYNIYLED